MSINPPFAVIVDAYSTGRYLAKEFGKAGFNFLGIHSNANEGLEDSRKYFQNSKLDIPVIQDGHSKIADEYKAFKTPHVFIVSPKLEILFQGGIDNSKMAHKADRFYLKDALTAIRNGNPLTEKNVRVLGCEIKRP